MAGPEGGGARGPGESAAEPNIAEVAAAQARARDALGTAFADNLIDADELDVRMEAVERAETALAVRAVTHDLVPQTTALARDDGPARDQITAVLSGAECVGAWTPAARTKVRAIAAGLKLDLREAALAPGVTEFELNVILGEVQIIVPPGLVVEPNCSLFLGEVEQDEPAPGAATGERRVRLTGHVILGSVSVKERLPHETRREAKRRRKATRKALKEARH